jgi:signal transduction histidine kinase
MITASPDLVSLARSQILLLTQTLGAGSSTMYLTEEVAGDSPPNLIEVVTYPNEAEALVLLDNPFLLPAAAEQRALIRQGRLVLPLVYEGTIMGILTTDRADRDWTEAEQFKVQQVANTLAIACALDRRCQWLEENRRRAEVEQRDFIATLFHQLRNPLTALRTFAQLLLRRILPGDPNQKIISGIMREASHIQDLLVQAEQETPMRLLEPASNLTLLPAADLELIDLIAVLEPVITSASAIATERKLHFRTQIPQNIPPVWANAAALREVLSNLIDNAIKYTPVGGTVHVEVRSDSNCVQISVQDTGLGIPESDMPHLFERNFRGQQAQGDILGTGLGLAIAQNLIQKMQGEIHVISQAGQGSTFTVVLKQMNQVELCI